MTSNVHGCLQTDMCCLVTITTPGCLEQSTRRAARPLWWKRHASLLRLIALVGIKRASRTCMCVKQYNNVQAYELIQQYQPATNCPAFPRIWCMDELCNFRVLVQNSHEYYSCDVMTTRIFVVVGWRPRRTIVFCAWGAEEHGIIGSREWVEVVSYTSLENIRS